MKKHFFGVMFILIGSILYSITLKEAYDSAPSQAGYDKYLELETGVTYTGGLLIGKYSTP